MVSFAMHCAIRDLKKKTPNELYNCQEKTTSRPIRAKHLVKRIGRFIYKNKKFLIVGTTVSLVLLVRVRSGNCVEVGPELFLRLKKLKNLELKLKCYELMIKNLYSARYFEPIFGKRLGKRVFRILFKLKVIGFSDDSMIVIFPALRRYKGYLVAFLILVNGYLFFYGPKTTKNYLLALIHAVRELFGLTRSTEKDIY